MPGRIPMKWLFLVVFVLAAQRLMAQSYAEKLLARADSAANLADKAKYLTDVSQYYWSVNPDQAIAYGKLALEVAERSENPERIGYALNAIGHAYGLKDNPVVATSYLLKALHTFEQAQKDKQALSVLNNLGIIELDQGNYQQALQYFGRYYEGVKDDGKTDWLKSASANMGVIYYHLSQYDSALIFQNQYLRLCEQTSDSLGMAIAGSNIADVFFGQKDYKKALDGYQSAYQMSHQIGDGEGVILTLIGRGKTLSRLGRPEEGIPLLEKALKIAADAQMISYQLQASLQLYQAEKQIGDYQKALAYHEDFARFNDSIFSKSKTRELTALKESYEVNKREAEIELLEKSEAISRLVNWGLTGLLLLVGILLTVLLRSNRIIRRANGALKESRRKIADQKESIEAHNEELQQQQEKIMAQRDALDVQNHKLEAAFGQIDKQHRNITASINYAKRIQEAALPELEKFRAAFADSFVLFRPRDIVSGDIYWFSEKAGKTYIAAVDCTGHGVPGAFMSLIAHNLLNQALHLKDISRPADILEYLHQEVQIALHQSDGHNQDGMDIALCEVDRAANKLTFAGANSPLLAISNGQMQFIKGDRQPIGGLDRRHREAYTQHELPLDASAFYLYSDGFQDQFGGKEAKKLGSKRFRNQLLTHAELPMQAQKQKHTQFLDLWAAEVTQLDDILLIGFRV